MPNLSVDSENSNRQPQGDLRLPDPLMEETRTAMPEDDFNEWELQRGATGQSGYEFPEGDNSELIGPGRKPQSIPYQGVNADMDLAATDTSTLAPGLKEEQKARMAGFSEEEIAQGRQEEIKKMQTAGFSEPEIQEVYALKDPDMEPFKATFTANLDAYKNAEKEKAANSTATTNPAEQKKQHPADNILEAMQAGWQGSVSGLFTGGLPTTVLPEDAGIAMQIAAAIPSLAGDMPTFLAGMTAGTAVGGPIVGAGAGFAVTEAYRDILMQHYTRGDISSARDFATRAVGTAWAASKGFFVGAATEFVGGKTGAKVLAKTGSEIFSGAARFMTEVPTMVGLAKGLEGELPNRDDFLVGGLTLGGFHGIRTVAPKLMGIYKDTGMRPSEIMEAAGQDVQMRQEIVAEDSNITPYQMQGLAPPDFGSVKNVIGAVKESIKVPMREAYQGLWDALSPANELGSRDLPGNQTKARALLEYQKTSSARVQVALGLGHEGAPADFGGTFDIQGNKTGESWSKVNTDAMKALHGKELSENGAKVLERIPEAQDHANPESKIWSAYLNARTVVERFEKTPDKKTGADLDAAKSFLKEHKDLEPIAKRFTAFNQRMIDLGVEAQLYDKAGVEVMKKVHEKHASLRRVEGEVDPLTGQRPKGSSSAALQKFKGNEEKLFRDPVVASAENAAMIVRAVERNRSRLHIAEMLKEHPEMGRIAENDIKATRVQSAEVKQWAERLGVDPEQVPDGFFDVFRQEPPRSLADNQIEFMENGKRKVMEVRKDLAKAINSLEMPDWYEDLPAIIKVFPKLAESSARFAKKMITMSPAFAERNVMRDQFETFINTGNAPVLPSVEAIGHFWKQDEVWQKAMMSGMMTEAYYDFKNYHKINFDKLSETQGIQESTWNMVKTPAHWMRLFEKVKEGARRDIELYPRALNASEMAPRIATAKAEGLMAGNDFDSLLRAGAAANDASVNFLKVGLQTKAVTRFFKFLSPGLAGMERMGRGITDPEVHYRGFYALTIPTIANWMVNRDKSIYQSQPAYKLQTGIFVSTSHWGPAVNRQDWESRPPDMRRVVDGKYEVDNATSFYIPKPPGYGAIFSTLPEMALNAFYKTHKADFKEFDKAVIDAIMPDVQVNVALPFVEWFANRNLFTGNPIVSQATEGLMPHLQQMPYTSETAKQLGKLVGASPFGSDIGEKGLALQSPALIDTFIRDWTGPTGAFVTQIVDKILHKAGVGNQTEPPYQGLLENPFINGFTHRFPNARVQDVEDFYRRYTENKVVQASFNSETRHQNPEGAKYIQDNYGHHLVGVNDVAETLSGQHKFINAVTNGEKWGLDDFKKMSGVEKRQLIDSVYFQMWHTAKVGNRRMDEFEAQVKASRKH